MHILKSLFRQIRLFFACIVFGSKQIKDTEVYKQPVATVDVDKEQQQESVHKFLTEECIAWDPTSKEAQIEFKVMDELLGPFDDKNWHEIERGDDKTRNRLIGKTD